jgi:hypothetical protein
MYFFQTWFWQTAYEGTKLNGIYSNGIKVRKSGILWKTTQRCTSVLTYNFAVEWARIEWRWEKVVFYGKQLKDILWHSHITLQWSEQATYESRPTHPPCGSQVRRGGLLPEYINDILQNSYIDTIETIIWRQRRSPKKWSETVYVRIKFNNIQK